jgi:hypothetical protein
LNKTPSVGLQVLLGFLLGIALNVVMIVVGFLLPLFFLHDASSAVGRLQALMLTGAVQLAWQVPLIFLFRRLGQKSMALGVILACSIFVLLNALCWAVAGNIRVGG